MRSYKRGEQCRRENFVRKPVGKILLMITTLTAGMGLTAASGVVTGTPSIRTQRSSHSEVTTLAPGSAARKRLFDAMRPAFEKELHQKVIFTAPTLRVSQGWAFVTGQPLQPNQKPIDYRKTKYWEARKYGSMSNDYCALLRSVGGNRWKLVTYHIGQTDVFWQDWPQKYHAPAAIFDLPVRSQ